MEKDTGDLGNSDEAPKGTADAEGSPSQPQEQLKPSSYFKLYRWAELPLCTCMQSSDYRKSVCIRMC